MPDITFSTQNFQGMSFQDAFNAARNEVGSANGIFYWNGAPYNTALEGESLPEDYSHSIVNALNGHTEFEPIPTETATVDVAEDVNEPIIDDGGDVSEAADGGS